MDYVIDDLVVDKRNDRLYGDMKVDGESIKTCVRRCGYRNGGLMFNGLDVLPPCPGGG